MLSAAGALGLLAVGSLVEADGHLEHLVSDDEVAAVTPFPHARCFQFQDRRGGLGRDRVQVVVAHEAGLAVLDAVDDPGGVQLDGRPAQRGHALELDEGGVVVAQGAGVCHQAIVPRGRGVRWGDRLPGACRADAWADLHASSCGGR